MSTRQDHLQIKRDYDATRLISEHGLIDHGYALTKIQNRVKTQTSQFLRLKTQTIYS